MIAFLQLNIGITATSGLFFQSFPKARNIVHFKENPRLLSQARGGQGFTVIWVAQFSGLSKKSIILE